MTKTNDLGEWRSWAAGYRAGGRNWRTRSEMKCPRQYVKTAYERGWLEGKADRAAIEAKQQEQYRWRAAAGKESEQAAAKAKAKVHQLDEEIRAMLAAMRGRRRSRRPEAD
jgi:hypothetical protein